MSRNAPKCILGAVVVAVFFALTWSTSAARLFNTTNSSAVEAGAASFDPPSPMTVRPLVIDSAPNVSLEAIVEPSMTAMFAPPKANLDQTRNGTPVAPISPPNWVNGNAGASQAHYNEGHSIPYRVVLTDLDTSVATHFIDIEWDIRHSSKNAIDYITHYQRLNPHLFIPAHAAETVDPTIGVAGVSAAVFATKAIPEPNTTSPSVATASFNALPAGEREMTIFNGSISNLAYLSEGSLAAASSSTRMRVTFNATDPTVIISWGGHIGQQSDWGIGNSASAVSGSPYHTRLLSLDGASTGSQDRSLSAGAVFIPPDCVITGNDPVCPGSTNSYSAPVGSFTYLWTISGDASISGSDTGQTVSVVAATPNPCPGSYTLTLKLTRTSDGGMNTCTKTVSVADTSVPVITCPAAAQLQCGASTLPANTGTATATDNCPGTVTISFTDAPIAANCTGRAGISRTWKATDSCGNMATCVQQITFVDTTAPSITCPADQQLQCGASTDPSNTGTATASDNCLGTVTITFADASTDPNCTGQAGIDRTWTAVDGCGNTATCVQHIVFVDTTKPVITCPADKELECDASTDPSNTGSATATDNCGGTPTITHTDVDTPATCSGKAGVDRTWRAEDACGNFSTCVQHITFVDHTAPEITCPGDKQLQCGDSTDPSNTGSATATDNCGGTVTIEHTDVATPASCTGVAGIDRTWKATDACGNYTECVQHITFVDTTPPLITCPSDKQLQCGDSTDPADTGSATATDNCAAAVTISFTDEPTAANCSGRAGVDRTWKATDGCGNMSTCVQHITFVDTTPPDIHCPDPVTVTCLVNVPPADFDGGSASDNCTSVTITHSEELTDQSSCGDECGGKILRTYTAEDACGNKASCTQVITYGTPGSAEDVQQQVFASLLKSGDIVVGSPGRSLTIPGGPNAKSSALCIVSKLSASGSATSLPDFGDVKLDSATCQTSPPLDLQANGTWKNALLSRAISLALNLRFDAQQQQLIKQQPQVISRASGQQARAGFELASFALASTLWTQGVLPGPDGLVGTSDDELDSSSARMQILVPGSVLTALGPNATAADLLRLANAALAGQSTGDVGLSDITAAVDAINRGFDLGRRRLMVSASQR